MRASLLLPLVLLVAVAVAWVLIAVAARRQRQLLVRLAEVVPGGRPGQPAAPSRSIRMRRQRQSKFSTVARLLKMPLDLPLANVIAPGWVFVTGTAIASGIAWLSHFLTSLPASSAVGLVVWLVLVRGIFGWEIARYQAKLVRQLPDTVQLVVSATRAGLPVSEAFRAIAQEMPSPTREEFVRVENEMALGGAPDEALLSLHQRTGVTEYAIFAVTIGVQARSGGRLAETIQNLAETVRERLAITARAKALAGEAKVSAIIMGILPILAGGLMSVTQPQQMMLLFTDPRGVRMFVTGIVTFILGVVTMQQLIRGASKD
jgi:tight adherence protein B